MSPGDGAGGAATAAVCARRRERVLEALGDDAALILVAAPEVRVGRDLELRYRPDPDLHYLTGYPEPGAVAVLAPAGDDGPFTLFVRPRDSAAERWTGARGGPAAARERYGADAAHPLDELESKLAPLLRRIETVYVPLHLRDERVEALLRSALARARAARQRTGRGIRSVVDAGALLDGMRLIKEPGELALLREAAAVTAAGVRQAAGAIGPGAGEWEVEAALVAAFRRHGAETAFAPIVAGGANATVLHYIENRDVLAAGALVLLDAGASVGGYAGDISRTFPVSGRFTDPQRDVYDAVLAARDAGIEAVRPGATTDDVHRAALRVLLTFLRDQRLLEGELDGLLEREDDYKPFFPHKTSHWIGLDVHDVGDYAVGGEPRRLEPGMVLTVEPGLYFPATGGDPAIGHGDPAAGEPDGGSAAEHPAVPGHFEGIGIRIEDDVAVTDTGHEVLSASLPADADAVQGMVGGGG